jgi:signal transduction histidine kinase
MIEFRWRFFWPVTLTTVLLVGLCVYTAVSLFRQQATIARVLHENMASRRSAVEMEECLTDLVTLENEQVEAVSPLHDRVRRHLESLVEVADEPEERRLSARMTAGFQYYLIRWQKLPPPADPLHDAARRDATRSLEAEVLRPCTEFRLYNGHRLEETTAEHERVLRQLAWGMGGLSALGGFAGLVLGFGVATGLTRSIRRLQVQIRDAAGKLNPNLSEIVVSGEGGFGGLHEQIGQLTTRIEETVRRLHQREREVLRAEQLAAVGQLAAGVGHEIRNPLASIKMLVQAGLEDTDRTGLTDEDLRVIESEIRRVERSLSTFLDFSRPTKPERRPVELAIALDKVTGLVRGRAEKQHVRTKVDVPPAGVTLTVDPGQFRQVLVNLVLNALDAMPTGGTLALGVRQAGGWVTVEVADTGAGIPPEHFSRLFDPFFSTKDTGLGLGLVISRRIVEDHGGTIGAANRPGGGASFFVRLPLAPL